MRLATGRPGSLSMWGFGIVEEASAAQWQPGGALRDPALPPLALDHVVEFYVDPVVITISIPTSLISLGSGGIPFQILTFS